MDTIDLDGGTSMESPESVGFGGSMDEPIKHSHQLAVVGDAVIPWGSGAETRRPDDLENHSGSRKRCLMRWCASQIPLCQLMK